MYISLQSKVHCADEIHSAINSVKQLSEPWCHLTVLVGMTRKRSCHLQPRK